MKLTHYKKLPYPQNLWSAIYDRELQSEDVPDNWEEILSYARQLLKIRPKNIDILTMYFCEGCIWKEIGAVYHIHKESAYQIAKLTLQHLNKTVPYLTNSKAPDPSCPIDMGLPIAVLDLTASTRGQLNQVGINTLDDLCQRTKNEIAQVRRIGKGAMDEINKGLDHYGLALKAG